MGDRTFCRIERGELAADLLYQDEEAIAFKDIAPRAPFHVRVVPRQHIPSIAETADESRLGHLVRVCAKLATDAGFGERGFCVQTNTGPEGGQDVLHLHWHVYAGRQLPPLPPV